MSAVVAVAIHLASELSPDLAERTVRSCEAALGAEHCRLEDDSASDAYYATVTSDGNDAVARIKVLRHRSDPVPVAERELAFAPEDSPGDRWASVGVVIAALVTAAAGATPPPSPPPAPPRPAPVRRKAAPAPPPLPKPWHAVRLDLLARLSRATDTNYPAELGGLLRGSFSPAQAPLFVRLVAGYGARLGRQPELTIPGGGLGGGFRWGAPDARWGAEAHLEGRTEYWILSASEPGRTDTRGVWRFGGEAGLDATWGFLPELQAVAGASAEMLGPRVTVDVRRQNTERVPLVGVALVLGLRFVP